MNKGLNVLSLFDGMSCGQISFERAGIKVDNYYASEIDKYAMQVAVNNYPNTKQLGSVIDLTDSQLLELKKEGVDILIGGSPCQGFSVAGKMKGSQTKEGVDVTSLEQYLDLKEKGFEFDGQSYLFWEYVRVWKIVQPKYYFLENVRVTKKWLPMFNEAMGVEPIMINSALVSAQNRVRYYWTNIPNIEQPEDKGIMLNDILEDNVDKSFNLSDKANENPRNRAFKEGQEKSGALLANQFKQSTDSLYAIRGASSDRIPISEINKTTIGRSGIITHKITSKVRVRVHKVDIDSLVLTLRDAKKESGLSNKKISEILNVPITKVEHWFRKDSSFSIPDENIWEKLKSTINIKTDVFDKSILEFEEKDCNFDQSNRIYDTKGKSPTLTATKSDFEVTGNAPKLIVPEATKKGYIEVESGNCFDNAVPNSKTRRGGDMSEKSNALLTSNQFMRYEYPTYRKLTPVECERLQTVPDNYTNCVSNSQRYKMLGNGWTVDVIAHIFKNLK